MRHINSPQGTLHRFNEDFENTKSYLSILSEKLLCFGKMSSHINKEKTEYVNELNNYHAIFSSWVRHEPDLSNFLQIIGSALQSSASSQNSVIQSNVHAIANPVKDLLSYVEVVQETIKKRESYQYAYEASLDELNKRYGEKDKVCNLRCICYLGFRIHFFTEYTYAGLIYIKNI